jgi:hypothetical protein
MTVNEPNASGIPGAFSFWPKAETQTAAASTFRHTKELGALAAFLVTLVTFFV